MSGGGSTSSEVKIPEWLQDASKVNLARADDISKIGYTPYYGPDVAALTPQQVAAMQSTNGAAQAFGMATPQGGLLAMQPETFAGGVQAHSAGGLYQGALDQLRANAPGQFDAIMAMFLNPQTGAGPANPFATAPPQQQPQAGGLLGQNPNSGGEPSGNFGGPDVADYGGWGGFGSDQGAFGGGLY